MDLIIGGIIGGLLGVVITVLATQELKPEVPNIHSPSRTCGNCGSTNIASGSWVPDTCRDCGSQEINDQWYR